VKTAWDRKANAGGRDHSDPDPGIAARRILHLHTFLRSGSRTVRARQAGCPSTRLGQRVSGLFRQSCLAATTVDIAFSQQDINSVIVLDADSKFLAGAGGGSNRFERARLEKISSPATDLISFDEDHEALWLYHPIGGPRRSSWMNWAPAMPQMQPTLPWGA